MVLKHHNKWSHHLHRHLEIDPISPCNLHQILPKELCGVLEPVHDNPVVGFGMLLEAQFHVSHYFVKFVDSDWLDVVLVPNEHLFGYVLEQFLELKVYVDRLLETIAEVTMHGEYHEIVEELPLAVIPSIEQVMPEVFNRLVVLVEVAFELDFVPSALLRVTLTIEDIIGGDDDFGRILVWYIEGVLVFLLDFDAVCDEGE